MDALLEIDAGIFLAIQGVAHALPAIAPGILFLGEWALYPILAALAFIYIYAHGHRHTRLAHGVLLSLISALVARFGVTELLQNLFMRERPYLALDLPTLIQQPDYSFPSGHATFFFALALSLYYTDRRLGVIMFLLAGFISLARVMAGVHYPLDILAGALVGLATAYAIHWAFNRHKGKASGGRLKS